MEATRAETSETWDTVIIGSGIGGLCAALTLSRAGKKVLVLEGAKQFGGYLNPFKRGHFEFDPGLHYLGECGPEGAFTHLLGKLGLRDQVSFVPLPHDAVDRLHFPEYSVDMPSNPDEYERLLARDFPDEAPALRRFFKLLAGFHDLVGAGQGHRNVTPRDHLSGLARTLPYLRSSYGKLLDETFRSPVLKAVLAGQNGDYALPPSRASALIGLGLLDHYLHGAHFPVGGSRALRDVLVAAIRQNGATMLRNKKVEKILLEGSRAIGVRCDDGDEYRARSVVSNADALKTYEHLVGTEALPPGLRAKVARTEGSLASFCMFLGTDYDLAAHGFTAGNLWHYDTTDLEAMYRPMLRGELPDRDFFFLSSPTLKDPGTHHGAPAGKATLEFVTLMPYAPFSAWEHTKNARRGEAYEAFKRNLAERYLTRMEAYLPGLRSHIQVLEIATPLTNASFALAPRGAVYGTAHNPDNMGPFRLGVASPIRGLYLCGASAEGAGIVTSAASGHHAARACLGALDAPVRTGWRGVLEGLTPKLHDAMLYGLAFIDRSVDERLHLER